MSERTLHNARWVIVSVNKPIILRRSDEEAWILNPKRRYVLNAEIIAPITSCIESCSDLEASAHYNPLRTATKVRLPRSSLLIERYRDRGIGDLLFTTGPLAYLHHLTGGDLRTYYYAYADRGAVLSQCPFITDNAPLVGPILYDELPLYDHHWFIDTVTEYNEEPDQLNVYDALFKSLGISPETVDPRFKRPYAALSPDETRELDDLFYFIWASNKLHVDLRKTGYYVIAPFSNSNLRSAPYATWLQVIGELSKHKPVLVVGVMRDRMPATDMSPGDFVQVLEQNPSMVPSGRVINMIGKTSVRSLMQLISRAYCVGSMDSAALYIAQAFRVPCVSVWGSHDPAIRIGYDRDYMELALWHRVACTASPCYASSGFPENKCPLGPEQNICQVLSYTEPAEIFKKFEAVNSRNPMVVKPEAVKTE